MDAKQQEAFDAWARQNDPRTYPAERQAFEAGWNAAQQDASAAQAVPTDDEIYDLSNEFSGMTYEDLDVVAFGRALLARYAAPPNEAAIRNAAYERAAVAADYTGPEGRFDFQRAHQQGRKEAASRIRALKTDQQEQK